MHKFREAVNKRYGFVTDVLALDLHHAFDTVKRIRLMDVLSQSTQKNEDGSIHSMFTEDELRMIRVLMAPNISRVRVGKY